MFKFLIGALTGLVISLVFLCITEKVNAKLDISVITNIIIAIATVVAAAVHYDFQKKQRLDRVWDINKGVLLDLTYALSEVIEATEIEIHNRFGSHCERTEVKPYVWRGLDEKIDYMLNVYSPLVSFDLLTAVNHYKKVHRDIVRQVDHEGLDTSSAYEEMLPEYKALYKQLLSFVAKISGVSPTLQSI